MIWFAFRVLGFGARGILGNGKQLVAICSDILSNDTEVLRDGAHYYSLPTGLLCRSEYLGCISPWSQLCCDQPAN